MTLVTCDLWRHGAAERLPHVQTENCVRPAPAPPLAEPRPAGWGWCPNTSLRIPKGECGCCPDPDGARPSESAEPSGDVYLDDGQGWRRTK